MDEDISRADEPEAFIESLHYTTVPSFRSENISGYGLGVLNRESLDFELGVDAQRRESPMLGGTDNGFLGRGTLGW